MSVNGEIEAIINSTEPTKDELDTFKNLVSEWFKYDVTTNQYSNKKMDR